MEVAELGPALWSRQNLTHLAMGLGATAGLENVVLGEPELDRNRRSNRTAVLIIAQVACLPGGFA